MPRFFTSAVQFDEAASVGSAVIDGEDGRHIARSLRMHTGDALTLSDGAGTDYTGEIESITGDTVMVRLTDKFKNRSEPALRVTLYPGMPKADKLELITQKAVELGVTKIVPVLTSRSVSGRMQNPFQKNKSVCSASRLKPQSRAAAASSQKSVK